MAREDNLHDLERNILATMLMSAGAGYEEAEQELEPQDFTSLQHRKLFGWIGEQIQNRMTPDISMLLSDDALCSQVGGKEYIQRLIGYAGPPASIKSWANRLHNSARLLKVQDAADQIIQLSKSGASAADVAKHAEQIILNATSDRYSEGPQGIASLVDNRLNQWGLIQSGELKEYIPSGFGTFDDHYFGWPLGYPVIVGGRTKMGKTMFMLSAALRGAHTGVPQGILSIEMPASSLMDRLAGVAAGVPSFAAHRGTDDEMDRLWDALSTLKDLPVYIDESSRSLSSIESSIRRMARRDKVKVIWLDYLQLIRGNPSIDNPTFQIEEISEAIRAIAKSENVCIINMMQFNRDGERVRIDGKLGYPTSTAFRGSDRPLFDSAIAFGLYRPWHYQPPVDAVTNQPIPPERIGDKLQPLELVCLACRYTAPKTLKFWARLSVQQLFDEKDPGFDG